MERRSWPWKRKSSEKASGSSDSTGASLSNGGVKQGGQEHTKLASFMQISIEKYEHLNGLEGLVEVLNEKLDDMKEKLSSARADTTTKDELVKQHAKVAEEAISGWEKAEAETLALKHHLESVTLLKLTAEERAAHLDSALKECMKQICNVKEESEHKLHDVVFAKTTQWEKVKSELDATIAGFEQERMKNSAEIAALARSLQECSVLLMKIGKEKAQADAEIEILKTNIQSYQREISSLKYELNVATKEVEVRNEEKNMSVKSAEVATKQHSEDVKKITKLEAECQRLRGLVRKKLPGPAALAQMKLEVKSIGQDFGESRVRRQSGSSSPYPVLAPEITVYEVEHYHKENEFLAARLLAMEEEAKLLKDSVSKRNSELQASRSTCAKTANKLRSLEAQILTMNRQSNSLRSNAEIFVEGSSSHTESNLSLTSMSEDGIDDEGSCVESWASALILELSQFKKNTDSNASKITHNTNQLELMDDFLEMERLAGMSSENNEAVSVSDEGVDKMKNNGCEDTASIDVHMHVCKEETLGLKQHPKLDFFSRNQPSRTLLSKVQMHIAFVVKSEVLDAKIQKLLEKIMKLLKDAQDGISPHSNDHLNMEAQCSLEGIGDSKTSLKQDNMENFMNQELRTAISWIHYFVLSLYKEVTQYKSSQIEATRERVEEFSESLNKYFHNKLNLDGFILSLCHVLYETKELRLKTWDIGENSSTDCIDKVTLLENGVALHDPMEEKLSGDHDLSLSASDPQVIEGLTNPTSESKTALQSFSLEEFEDLKIEKDNMSVNLANCTETLELTKLQLAETEQKIEELKQQLSASQKSNDLAETQLRCMTGSYKLLESRAQELESEINLLRTKAEALESELSAESHSHQDDLAKYNDLQKHMRSMTWSKCLCHSEAVADTKEREIATAAEKLVECQETIILLTKQLNAMCPPVEPVSISSHFRDEHGLVSHSTQQSHYSFVENYAVSMSLSTGIESPLDECNSQFSASNIESSPTMEPTTSSKRPKHRCRSTSASSLSSMLNDKQRRRISRFFSKGRSEY